MPTHWLCVCWLTVWLTVVLMCLESVCMHRPCYRIPDPYYNGTTLDCMGRNMLSEDVDKLNSTNVTTLIMSNNDIQTLFNNSFSRFSYLKRLDCDMCNLQALEVDALAGLQTLEALFLGRNNLVITDYTFPSGFFRHVPKLKTLYLGHNGKNGNASNYSQFIDIFKSLPELRNLTIDSFQTLTIGEEFTKFKKLNSLEITCGSLEDVTNQSLSGFEHSPVKHVALLDGGHTMHDQDNCDMLHFLPNVSSLMIQNISFGNAKVLKMLEPLQEKTIDLLYFDNVGLYLSTRSAEDRANDRMFTADKIRYLKKICVSDVTWLNSYSLFFDLETLSSDRWEHCIRSLILSTGGSPVIANRIYLFQLMRFRKLERFVFISTTVNAVYDIREVNRNTRTRSITQEQVKQSEGRSEKLGDSHESWHGSQISPRESSHDRGIHNDIVHNFSTPDMIIYLPPFLKEIIFDHPSWMYLGHNLRFENNSVRSVFIRGLKKECDLSKKILGLNNLENVDLTGTFIRGDPAFFKRFPALRELVLEDTQGLSSYYSQVASNVVDLEYFNIADNSLEWLPSGTFHSSSALEYLCLASNKFGKIPFDLRLTPNLKVLDLRKNAIVFTQKDLRSIDDHKRAVANFTLLLSNNQMLCTCSALFFLQWLRYTTVQLDHGGNYSCMTEEGTLSNTASFSDVKSLMIKCYGPSYFLVSLILLSNLIAAYMATFLGMKHKTQILAKTRQLVVPGFRLKTREDFNLDVVIGYADQDGDYVRDVLLRYLENMWHIRTFVHQRDLLQDPLLMSQAIRDSWRTLLLITENFLDNHHMAHNVMKVCSFFVHPSNPRSVIVMVDERVQHRIPDHVLQVVDEDNIIVLPALEGWLDYEAKETLKTRIL